MNETKEKKYLIVSMHCLENTDGYGTIRYLEKQIRNKMPLVEVPFNDHNPMCYFHNVIRTNRPLTGKMILNCLSTIKYNQHNPVTNDEIFFAIHEDGILYCYYDKDSRNWEVDDLENIFYDEISEKQVKRIASRMRTFYEEYIDNPKDLHYLQHEYLDFIYC